MADTIQRVQIIVENMIKGAEKIDAMTMGYRRMGDQFRNITRSITQQAINQTRAMDILAKKNEFLSNWSDKLGVNTRGVTKIMSSAGLTFNSVGNVVDLAGRKVNDLSRVMLKNKRAAIGFQFEWLSVMFIGMAINRMFSVYTKGALEWLGVTDLFTESLKLAVFTALEPFHNTLINLSVTIFDLIPQMQALVGWFILFGQGIGGTLSFLGQFFLGFQGIKILLAGFQKIPFLTPLLAGLKAVGAAIAGLGLGTILAIIGIIIAAITSMYIAWKEDFFGMKETVSVFVSAVKQLFLGLFNVILGWFRVFLSILKGDWDGAMEHLKNIFRNLVNSVIGLFMALASGIGMILTGIVRISKFIIDTIFGFFVWLYQKLVGGSLIPNLVNAIIFWFWKLPSAIMSALTSILKNVFDWGVNFIKNMGEGIASMAGKFKDWFLSIFPSWARSSIWSSGQAVLEIITNIVEKVKRVVSGRQHGGSVFGGNPYLVGEVGPELFVPSGAGRIIPNNKLGGAGSGQIIFSPVYNIHVADKAEFERLIKNNNTRQVEDLRRIIQD